ncbi:MAG: ATP/GTP-binding protein, partial [Methanomassiliicoccales archaeon]
MQYIYFVGTAGSGKSSLVYAFKEWMTLQGLDCITVNLDPGAEDIPYDIDVDIRDWVKVSEVMEEYELGPNGAQVVCADLMAMSAKDLAEAIEGFRTNYVLIDTPGQIELFAFRKSSEAIIDTLGRDEAYLIYLSDPHLAKTPSGFVTSLMLCATVFFRFNLPFLNVLSKADMLKEEEFNQIVLWSEDPDALNAALSDEHLSARTIMNIELFKAMENVGMFR